MQFSKRFGEPLNETAADHRAVNGSARKPASKSTCGGRKYWVAWGDALREAGYEPNTWTAAHPDDHLMRHYAVLAREVGHMPTVSELQLKRRSDASFPSEGAFRRLGTKRNIFRRLRVFCDAHSDFRDIVGMINGASDDTADDVRALRQSTVAVGLLLPEPTKTVHVIETDDPEGIEAYWHRRFGAKRGGSHWRPDDIAAFKRRRSM